MVTVTLAASLATYLPEDPIGPCPAGHRSVTLAAESWQDTVQELRSRFDRLGEHLFEESGRLRSGFLVAVNDQLIRHEDGPRNVRSGDKVYLFAQIAGG